MILQGSLSFKGRELESNISLLHSPISSQADENKIIRSVSFRNRNSQANKEDVDSTHFVIQERLKTETPPTLLHIEKDQVQQHSPNQSIEQEVLVQEHSTSPIKQEAMEMTTEQEVVVQEHSTSPIKQEEKERTIESATHENEASPKSPHGKQQSNKEGSKEQTISLSSEAASRVKDDPKD